MAAPASWPRNWAWNWPRAGHEVHFISYAPPARLTAERAHHLPRSGNFQLSAFRPRALRAHAGGEDAGGGGSRAAGPAARALRDSAFGERDAGAVDGGPATFAVYHHASRHGHHPGGQRPEFSADHAIFHRAIRRGDLHLQLSQEEDHRGVRHQAAHRGDSQFRQL